MPKYADLCVELDRAGYMSNAIGMCRRELHAMQCGEKSRVDRFLSESATYSAFQKAEKLNPRFDPGRAERCALVWTHDLKTSRKCPPFPVRVDWSSGVVKQENASVFGLLEDVRHCIVDAPATSVADFDRFTTTKPKPNGKGEARIGQSWYREKLMQIWQGRCAVTGCDQPELLRASHIVAWKDAAGHERLDPANGLLLVAHLDAAFDRGLISFADDGRLLPSASLSPATRQHLGISSAPRLCHVPALTAAYLARHRARHGY